MMTEGISERMMMVPTIFSRMMVPNNTGRALYGIQVSHSWIAYSMCWMTMTGQNQKDEC